MARRIKQASQKETPPQTLVAHKAKSREIEKYFHAEKAGALLAMVVGVAGLLVGTIFIATQIRFVDAAYPILLFSIIALIAGGSVWLRTDAQLARLLALFQKDPRVFAAAESARMNRVLRNFKLYRWAELALVLVAVWLLTTRFGKPLGAGLLIETLLLLVFDGIAEARGRAYARFVASTQPNLRKKD